MLKKVLFLSLALALFAGHPAQARVDSQPTATSIGAQPLDSDLTCVAGLSSTGLVNRTGSGTCATKTAPAGAVVGTSDTQTLTNKTYGSGINIVSMSAVAVTRNSANTSADANYSAFYTIPIPALGANDCVRVTYTASNVGTSAKSFQVAYGGTAVHTADQTTNLLHHYQVGFCNRNATNSQASFYSVGGGNGGWASNTSTINTMAVDSSVSQNLVIQGKWSAATSAESLSLQMYQVELMRP